jgi:hypothetical protein
MKILFNVLLAVILAITLLSSLSAATMIVNAKSDKNGASDKQPGRLISR